MAYKTPRTWTTGEVVTAAHMNEQVSGNVAHVYALAQTKTVMIEAVGVEEPTYGGTVHRWIVPSALSGGVITAFDAAVSTAGTAGTVIVQLERNRGGTVRDVLSTRAVIDANEYSSYTGTTGVIDSTYRDLATGDWLSVVLEDHGGGTVSTNGGQKGLYAIVTVSVT